MVIYSAGFDTLGPWSVGLKTPGRDKPSKSVRAGPNWVPTGPEQVCGGKRIWPPV